MMRNRYSETGFGVVPLRDITVRWLPGRLLRTPMSYVRWWSQGRPRDFPVIVKPGRLIAYPDGGGRIEGWHLNGSFMRRNVSREELWDRLSALYSVERESNT